MRAALAVGVGQALVSLKAAYDAGPEGNVQSGIGFGGTGVVFVGGDAVTRHRAVAVGKDIGDGQDVIAQAAFAFAGLILKARKWIVPGGVNREIFLQRGDGS